MITITSRSTTTTDTAPGGSGNGSGGGGSGLVSLTNEHTTTAPPSTVTPSSSNNATNKPAIVISARVHPGESNSSYMMQGVMEFLVSDCPEVGQWVDSRYVGRCQLITVNLTSLLLSSTLFLYSHSSSNMNPCLYKKYEFLLPISINSH